VSWYLVVKFVHVLVAIVAVGSSAGSSLWLRLAMRSPAHLPFALRSAKFLDESLTRPGLIVLLITGLWMAASRWTLALFWIWAALVLVVIVLIVLYVISALLAAVAGFLISGLTNTASVTLADSYVLPSVAAAVIGGTSILGGRGGYSGTIIGALILTVLTALLSSLGYPEAVRQVLFGAIIVAVAAAYTRVTGET